MRLTSSLKLVGNVYHAQIGVADADPFTVRELDVLAKIGEPEVSIGGNFTGAGVDFTLDAREVLFPSGFPVKRQFDLDDDVLSGENADVYLTTLKTRVTAAMVAQNAAYVAIVPPYTITDDISTL